MGDINKAVKAIAKLEDIEIRLTRRYGSVEAGL